MTKNISIDSVFLEFGDHKVLRGINLVFEQHQVVGLLGRNGCGKSCLLKIIIGELLPQSMHLRWGEQQLFSLYKKRGLINYLPQHECHPHSLRLRSMLKFYDVPVRSFLDTYSFLAEQIDVPLFDLSGGQRRLIEVLVVLESPVRFSILDEPFSHVMPKHIGLLQKRMRSLTSRKGIVITDHQYRNVLDISDQLFLMRDGMLRRIEGEEDLRFYQYIR
ncbi:MAG: ATP-binding cassette domain-containing protein [Bacteroidota bacterium]